MCKKKNRVQLFWLEDELKSVHSQAPSGQTQSEIIHFESELWAASHRLAIRPSLVPAVLKMDGPSESGFQES